jgi:hypothetical protein
MQNRESEYESRASQAYSVLGRLWRPHLTSEELAIVSYLIDYTLAEGRETLDATFKQLENGVPAEKGPWPWRLSPLGIPRASFYRACSRLKARRLMNVDIVGGRLSRFSVNWDWLPVAASSAA